MVVNKIVFDKWFLQEFKSLPEHIKNLGFKQIDIFKTNPFHPSLRLHKLSWKLDWLWSISLNMKYRIIFKPQENWDVLLVSVGTHSIYN